MKSHKKDPDQPTTAQCMASTLIGNTIEVTTTNVIQQAIVLMQAPQDNATKSASVVGTLRKLVKDGKAMNGLGANLAGKTFQRLIKFGGADFTEKLISGNSQTITPFQKGVAGALAGSAEGVATFVSELIRKHQTIHKAHKGFMSTYHFIRATHGSKFLTYGAGANIVTKAAFTANMFYFTGFFKNKLPKSNDKRVNAAYTFSASFLASVIGIYCCNPTDVLHSNLVKAMKPGKSVPYQFFGLPTLSTLYQEQGVKALVTKGTVAKLFKLPLGMAIIMTINDLCGDLWHAHNKAARLKPN